MPTISHVTERMINARPLLQEAILEDIVSYASLAEKITPEIEKELGKKISHMAVVMAVRRYAEKIKQKSLMERRGKKKEFSLRGDIIMKTGICDIGILKSPSLFAKLRKISAMTDYEKGDVMNIIEGSQEIAIITNERYFKKIKEILKAEKIVNQQKSLALISINFSKKYVEEIGVIALITRRLAWDGINILEIVSTYRELSFVVSKDDVIKAYNTLQEMVKA